MCKELKVELAVFKPERFLPDSLRPCQHVCLRIVQPVGVLGLGPLLSVNALVGGFQGDGSGAHFK